MCLCIARRIRAASRVPKAISQKVTSNRQMDVDSTLIGSAALLIRRLLPSPPMRLFAVYLSPWRGEVPTAERSSCYAAFTSSHRLRGSAAMLCPGPALTAVGVSFLF